MDGLIIKKRWLDLILSGEKTWEIRGSNTKKRGSIALIESGSGQVVGTCEIADSRPVTLPDLHNNMERHHIETVYITFHLQYNYPHVWIIKNAKRVSPKKYTHPQGAVIWVKNIYEPDPCGICGERKASTKWFDSWENYVCDECDKLMDEGYKECYPDK